MDIFSIYDKESQILEDIDILKNQYHIDTNALQDTTNDLEIIFSECYNLAKGYSFNYYIFQHKLLSKLPTFPLLNVNEYNGFTYEDYYFPIFFELLKNHCIFTAFYSFENLLLHDNYVNASTYILNSTDYIEKLNEFDDSDAREDFKRKTRKKIYRAFESLIEEPYYCKLFNSITDTTQKHSRNNSSKSESSIIEENNRKISCFNLLFNDKLIHNMYRYPSDAPTFNFMNSIRMLSTLHNEWDMIFSEIRQIVYPQLTKTLSTSPKTDYKYLRFSDLVQEIRNQQKEITNENNDKEKLSKQHTFNQNFLVNYVPKIKNKYELYLRNESFRFLKNMNVLEKHFLPTLENSPNDILYRYKVERSFHFNLLGFCYSNHEKDIIKHEQKYYNYFDPLRQNQYFTKFASLPNVFSRTFIVNFVRQIPCEQAENFLDYILEYTFPVFEHLFSVALYKNCNCSLEDATKLLRTYVQNHSDWILNTYLNLGEPINIADSDAATAQIKLSPDEKVYLGKILPEIYSPDFIKTNIFYKDRVYSETFDYPAYSRELQFSKSDWYIDNHIL